MKENRKNERHVKMEKKKEKEKERKKETKITQKKKEKKKKEKKDRQKKKREPTLLTDSHPTNPHAHLTPLTPVDLRQRTVCPLPFPPPLTRNTLQPP